MRESRMVTAVAKSYFNRDEIYFFSGLGSSSWWVNLIPRSWLFRFVWLSLCPNEFEFVVCRSQHDRIIACKGVEIEQPASEGIEINVSLNRHRARFSRQLFLIEREPTLLLEWQRHSLFNADFHEPQTMKSLAVGLNLCILYHLNRFMLDNESLLIPISFSFAMNRTHARAQDGRSSGDCKSQEFFVETHELNGKAKRLTKRNTLTANLGS